MRFLPAFLARALAAALSRLVDASSRGGLTVLVDRIWHRLV